MYVMKGKKRLTPQSQVVKLERHEGRFNCSQFRRRIELAFIDSIHIKTNLWLFFRYDQQLQTRLI